MVKVENFSPNKFTVSVQGSETLHLLSYSLEYGFVLDRQGIVALSWVL